MSGFDLPTGTRVRATVEGVVTEYGSLAVKVGPTYTAFVPPAACSDVEVLPDPPRPGQWYHDPLYKAYRFYALPGGAFARWEKAKWPGATWAFASIVNFANLTYLRPCDPADVPGLGAS